MSPPLRPQPEPMLTIAPPPPAAMTGIACLPIRKTDFTLTAITRSHSSSVRLDDVGAADDARVVDEDVEPAEGLDGGRLDRPAAVGVDA